MKDVSLAARVWLVVLLLAPAPPLLAHHSVAGAFDVTKEVVVTGKIVKLDWINPHVFVYVEDAKGTRWAFESLPIHMFHKAGVTRKMLLGDQDEPGHTVTVKALPAHVTPNAGLITRISYQDGHFYQLYISPEAGKPAPEGRDR